MFSNTIRLTVKCLQLTSPLRGNVKNTPQLRRYAWQHRRPVRVVNEEEILNYVEEAEGPNEFIGEEPIKKDEKRIVNNERKPLKRKLKRQVKKTLKVTVDDSKCKSDGSLNVTEWKENDPALTSLMMSVRSKKVRDKNCRIILEGHRLIADAIGAGAIPEVIVFSRNPDVFKLPLPEKGVKLFKVPYRAIQVWSTLVTPPGIMGFFKIPEVQKRAPPPDALPLTIVCDNIRDPGNMGAILRAAAAVGCKKLITLIGCVDIWDPKVLKSGAGAHFRLPIFASKSLGDVKQFLDQDANVYVADHDRAEDVKSSLEQSESPNEEEEEPEEEQSEEVHESEEGEGEEPKKYKKNNKNISEYLEKKERHVCKQLMSNIPVIPYYGTNYTTGENVIFIGGETEGFSLTAINFFQTENGIRVNIPMTNGVDSLNTGTALGIIAFEVRRQFSVLKTNKDDNKSE